MRPSAGLGIVILYPSFDKTSAAPCALMPPTTEEASVCGTPVLDSFLPASATSPAIEEDGNEQAGPGGPHKGEGKMTDIGFLVVAIELVATHYVGSTTPC